METMTPAEIAAAVARALELKPLTSRETLKPLGVGWGEAHSCFSLWADGSNVFDSYWQARCRDWLLERGSVHFGWTNTVHSFFRMDAFAEDQAGVEIMCPASEFPARAIAELMKEGQ